MYSIKNPTNLARVVSQYLTAHTQLKERTTPNWNLQSPKQAMTCV